MNFKKQCPEGLTFPVDQAAIDEMKNENIVSVIAIDDPRVEFQPSEFPAPLTPADGDAFWGELVEVAKKVSYAKAGKTFASIKEHTEEYLQHDAIDASKDLVSEFVRTKYKVTKVAEGAELVHLDFPNKILSDLVVYLLQNGVRVRKGILPDVGFKRFTDGPVMFSHIVGWAVHQVSPTAFATKWYHGRLRPEEAIHAWATGELKAPQWADVLLASLVDVEAVKKNPAAFTMYPEGCPNHPSFPAMHGAAAGASVLFGVIFDLTDEELDLVRRTALNVAIFRDFAGVHYRQDSLTGLHIGEKVVAKKIGAFLAQYGADEAEVTELAESYVTGWV